MRDPALEKAILTALGRRNLPVTRPALAAEVEIILDRPLLTNDFTDALQQLTRNGLATEARNDFDLIVYAITKRGEAAR